MLLSTVDIVKKRLNKDLEISGVIVTMYNSRQNLDREVMETIRGHFKEKVFKTVIRKNVSLAEAPGFGQDIYQYKPDSVGAQDYSELCREIMRRGVV
jgi:chromosome partitioning protein